MTEIRKKHMIFIAGLPDIAPFTKGAIVPYLFAKYALRFQRNQHGQFLTEILEGNSDPDAPGVLTMNTVPKIKRRTLEEAERYFKKDYSKLQGDQKAVEFKIKLLTFTYIGFTNVAEVDARMDEDLKKLEPILVSVEAAIEKILPRSPTIIIEETPMNDADDFVRLLTEAKKLE